MLLVVVFATFVVGFSGERPALADGPAQATPATQKAKLHYLKGEAYFKAHDFSAAMGEYLSGYEERPDPVFIFNVAQCQRLLGHPGPALQSYRRYLAEAPEGAGRAVAEKQVAELEQLVAGNDQAHAVQETGLFGPAAVAPGGLRPPDAVAPAASGPEAAPAVQVAAASSGSASSVVPLPSSLATSAGTPPVPALTTTAAATSSSANANELLVTRAEAEPRPIYKRWWFWTAAAGVVSLFAVAAIASSSDRPGCDTGRLCR